MKKLVLILFGISFGLPAFSMTSECRHALIERAYEELARHVVMDEDKPGISSFARLMWEKDLPPGQRSGIATIAVRYPGSNYSLEPILRQRYIIYVEEQGSPSDCRAIGTPGLIPYANLPKETGKKR